ncbi:MAG: sulfurtransferase complex subunit TusD [Pseudomonadota bacterium]
MKFTLAVHGAPYASSAHQHALKFARACGAAGHGINRVFFYHEAVDVALNTRVAPQDEIDFTAEWQALAREYDIELAVCIANGIKRGVLSGSEAERYERNTATLSDGFELVGLGQLIEAISAAERYVEFPA